jgi:hypothetical protein
MVDISNVLNTVIQEQNCSPFRALFLLTEGEIENERNAIRTVSKQSNDESIYVDE